MQMESKKIIKVIAMTRDQLIRLIHVARRELGIDEDTYRAKLKYVANKTSCRDMNLAELNAVYDEFKAGGFKRRFNRNKTASKPRVNEHVRTEIIKKIRAVWLEMYRHKFLRCGNMAALDQYVQRITAKHNGGEGVARTDWLTGELATVVVETLKKWHMRCMREQLNAAASQNIRGYASLCNAFNAALERSNQNKGQSNE